jgi:3',5'-cyclic-nucleotide phosphodiesterase
VELYVVGCHGGETTKHKTCAFVVDEVLAIDAGSVTSGLDLAAQAKLEACVVSHAHLDHVRDLATLADNRCQMGLPPLVVAGTRATLEALRKHFFNGVLWPDFSAIPTASEPTIVYQELEPEVASDVAGYRVLPVLVSHSIESAGFVVRAPTGGAIAYSGDTGPTDRLFEVLDAEDDLRALLMEVSFPERERRIALASGHHTPATLAKDLAKLRRKREIPTLLYHIKPFFQAEVERECAAIPGRDLTVLALEDHFVL